jgi:hypothetical protein
MRGRSRVRHLVMSAALAAAAAACGIPAEDDPQVLGTDNLPPGLVEPDSSTTTSALSGVPAEAEVYFTHTRGDQTVLEKVERDVEAPLTAPKVIDALFTAVPTESELARGFRNALSEIAQVRGVNDLGDGLIEVDVSEGMRSVTGRGLQFAFGQIVCTADNVPGVRGVFFAIEGERQSAITGDGTATDDPAVCTNYRELL